MVQLLDQDIKTREVLDWEGVHLLHFSGSSCSQKTRIFLNLKGIDWVSHPVDLVKQENYTPWFLGINPRGLVPVLIHDGEVHIESNDILEYLDRTFEARKLIPDDLREEILGGLKEEDNLHLDLRALTMRFVVPKKIAQKKPQSLTTYETDPGTIEGAADPQKRAELDFWQSYADRGITDEQARASAQKFKAAYDEFEDRLNQARYLAGQDLTLLDVAWFIYTHRLTLAGYPFARLHPKIHAWYTDLANREAFAKEVQAPAILKLITATLHAAQAVSGRTLTRVAGF